MLERSTERQQLDRNLSQATEGDCSRAPVQILLGEVRYKLTLKESGPQGRVRNARRAVDEVFIAGGLRVHGDSETRQIGLMDSSGRISVSCKVWPCSGRAATESRKARDTHHYRQPQPK